MSLGLIAVRGIAVVSVVSCVSVVAPAFAQDYWRSETTPASEEYVEVPMPPGFSVQATELEGPVFADPNGMTLYRWQLQGLRNGDLGDRKDQASTCNDVLFTTNSGLMSPYPGGFELPELDTRPTCAEVWPAVLADEDAEEVGKWTILEREDGTMQWAHDGYPLYTSVLDQQPGDVLGGTKFPAANDGPAVRTPVGPPPNIPPSFKVAQVTTGRMLTDHEGFAIYAWDQDEENKSNCTGACLETWDPVLAPEAAQSQGAWMVIERSPGIQQWAYRGQPLYRHLGDTRYRSFVGSDVAGWGNVFTQKNPAPPAEFTIQDGNVGHVLADSRGRTIYTYNCGDDANDQLACDHPGTTQAYRLAVCGGGDVEKCHETWPYVLASKDAESGSRAWSVIAIDPKTGKHAKPDQDDTIHVWAYRGRPVFNFVGDKLPGDSEGDSSGEFNGYRNGFKAFWLRDDFLNNAG